jgi:hypothetical protein
VRRTCLVGLVISANFAWEGRLAEEHGELAYKREGLGRLVGVIFGEN